MYPDLAGKTVFLTGGGTGIGRAIAAQFAANDMRVCIADLDHESAQDVAAAIGNGATAAKIDVRNRASVEAVFEAAVHELGGVDVVAANAGVSTMNRAIDLTDEEWDWNFDVNARGVFLTNQIAARYFLKHKPKAAIVNTASLAARVGAPLLAHYSASKFAVLGWTQALARELAPHGVRVNAVCPGFVRTNMQAREIEWEASLRGISPEEVRREYIDQTPLGRLEEPEDVAKVVAFLASEEAGFMTGQGVNVTGGVYTG